MTDLIWIFPNIWLVLMVLAALHFVVRDFDVRSGKEWAAAALMFPAMATALLLALLDLARRIPGAAYWLASVVG